MNQHLNDSELIRESLAMNLYLVDSSIYIFRSWYAGNSDQVNNDGQANQAFIGFTDFVYRLLSERDPSRLVFAFDQSLSRSPRKLIYPEYKANRSPVPVELKRQFNWCQKWIENLGIPKVNSDTWEADDLIGTLATLHRSPELSIVILSADKDLVQLIREGDLWWTFVDDNKLDYRGIVKKYRVKPEQFSELLALAGDKVDNVPGIPHVGLKTAANLLRKFGDLENLRQNLYRVGQMKFPYAGRVQQSLIEHESLLDISSQLTRINCQVPEMRRVSIERMSPNHNGLIEMMENQSMDRTRRVKWRTFLDNK